MTCGLYDNDEHEDHFCHKCKHLSLLGCQDPDRQCKTCLDLGNCKFERDDEK